MSTIQEVLEGDSVISIDSDDTTIAIGGTSSIAVSNVSDLNDVDVVTEGKLDGSVLVYNVSTDKWVSTKTLEKQTMNGGFF